MQNTMMMKISSPVFLSTTNEYLQFLDSKDHQNLRKFDNEVTKEDSDAKEEDLQLLNALVTKIATMLRLILRMSKHRLKIIQKLMIIMMMYLKAMIAVVLLSINIIGCDDTGDNGGSFCSRDACIRVKNTVWRV